MSQRRRGEPEIEWRFFTPPVGFALALGSLLATIFSPLLPLPFFVISLFGTSFLGAHMLAHSWRRRSVRRRRMTMEEEERERRALAARAAREAAEAPSAGEMRRRRRRRRQAP